MTTFSLGTEFTGSPRLPRYVNGRLLAAADLSADQDTLRSRDRWIGRAAGSGVVSGLEVRSSATTLTVAPGLGVNRNGEPILLTTDATLLLAIPLAEAPVPNNARFGCCDSGPAPTTGALVAAGVYLLSARPACRTEGATAMAAGPATGGTGGCTASWTAAGVEFRVTSLPVGSPFLGTELTAGNRRNLVAHWCYGSDQLVALSQDPFAFAEGYGLDRVSDLTGDDLPLATFSWDGQAISDLDGWSARRRVVASEPSTGGWSVLTADRRIADGQARFHQFQQQADELLDLELASTTSAPDVFGLLPPVGFLPLDAGDLVELVRRLTALRKTEQGTDFAVMDQAAKGSAGSGFRLATFFSELAVLGGIIDWTLAELLLRESWHRPPVPTGAATDALGGWINELDDKDGANLSGDRTRGVVGNRRFTCYLVLQNLLQLGTTAPPSKKAGRQASFTLNRSNLYVVFVANYLWLGTTRPPVAVFGNQAPVPDPKSGPTPGSGPIVPT